MWIILGIIVAAFILFAIAIILVNSEKKKLEKHSNYICTECGEHDCICYSEDDTN